ncbi:TonB family protein [Paraburkholderia sp. Ac-20342]|uniref:TonB family protein n=1 Tax=Paraburkholderia sp. Ac-20342 TaxID=2703889 RepID=UPI00197DE3B9|nr:TonB family protein [Paraburkholderia sp. Ac-20342]MBN3848261.1 TonB family protein [Paraburkholderia sp. Ac-20342]
MATVPELSVTSSKAPRAHLDLHRAVPLALLVEALVLAGAFGLLAKKAPPPPPPPAVTLLALAPVAAPVAPPAPAPKPPEPVPVAKPIAPPRHSPVPVHHAAPLQPATPATPPAPPPTAQPSEPATDPAPPAPPPPPPAPSAGAVNPSFDAALRAAVQSALRYPESARMAGVSGRTRVAFTYRDGAVSDVRVVVSSGVGQLDRAALAAVHDAAYPKPAPELAGKTLSKQLWVTFALDDAQ